MTTEVMLLAIAIPVFYLTMFGEALWIHNIYPKKFKDNMGYTWIDRVGIFDICINVCIYKKFFIRYLYCFFNLFRNKYFK